MKGKVEPLKDEKIVDFYYNDKFRVATAVIEPLPDFQYKVGISIRSFKEKQDDRKKALTIARGRVKKSRNVVKSVCGSVMYSLPRDLYPNSMHDIQEMIINLLDNLFFNGKDILSKNRHIRLSIKGI